jgi:hypothetical protein
MNDHDQINNEQAIYQIRVEGILDENWSGYFSDLKITNHGDGCSTLAGPVRDQSALFGLLIKIRDLGIPLLEVVQMDDMPDFPPEKSVIG